jgi:hypothetical protein
MSQAITQVTGALAGGIVDPASELDRSRIAELFAKVGFGLDHRTGERLIGVADASALVSWVTLVTDQRVVNLLEDAVVEVPLAGLRSVRVKLGMLSRTLVASTDVGERELDPADFAPIHRFLEAVCAIPPEQRVEHRPLCAPSESDPTGARAAQASLVAVDDGASRSYAYLEAATAKGLMPASLAQDFVARVTLQHRNVHCGRGVIDGRLSSPVSANDLSNLMVTLFGAPGHVSEVPVRTLTLGSRIKPRDRATGFLDWAGQKLSPPPLFPTFNFAVLDTAPFTSFRLMLRDGRPANVEDHWLVHDIDVRLLEHEHEVLSRRLACGWNERTPDLLAYPPAQIAAAFERAFA